MAKSIDIQGMRRAISALRTSGVVPGIGAALTAGAGSTVPSFAETVIAEVPAYTDSGNPDTIPELRQHLADQVSEVCRLLGGGSLGDFAFVGTHAGRRAAQKFPLDAVLHSYRGLHRLLAVWVRDAALRVADSDAHMTRVVAAINEFTIEYIGIVSTLMTSAYVSQTRRLAEAEGDRRTELLNTLLHGYDESDRRTAELLRRAGYLQQRQSYCVVVAQSVEPREMGSAARVQRIADSIGKALEARPVRVISGLRDNLMTVVISGTRRVSGWTAPQSRLADQVEHELLKLGPSVLIGLSADQPSTSHIPRGLNEARIAFELSSVAARVVQFSKLPIRRLLLHVGGDQVKAALPAWTEEFLSANSKSHGKLVATLRAYAASDMSVLKAARALDVHPNTIYSRMGRIEKLTGMDAQRFDALNELLLAAELSG